MVVRFPRGGGGPVPQRWGGTVTWQLSPRGWWGTVFPGMGQDKIGGDLTTLPVINRQQGRVHIYWICLLVPYRLLQSSTLIQFPALLPVAQARGCCQSMVYLSDYCISREVSCGSVDFLTFKWTGFFSS